MFENSFNQLSYVHISRIFNREAERLSKLEASCEFDMLFFQEVIEEKISMEGSVSFD